jgi:hypothetical protein
VRAEVVAVLEVELVLARLLDRHREQQTVCLACSGTPFGRPNCSSTRQPVACGSTPSSVAFRSPSKIRCFASAICSVCSGVGSPSIPNIFFWNEPR